MRRLTALLASLLLLLAACSADLGRTLPACDEASATLVLEMQSVPGAAYVPCIESLHTGWHYRDMEADSRGASFQMDAERLGYPFLTVELLPRCDPGHLPRRPSDEPGAFLFQDVVSESTVSVVIVPEGHSAETESRAVEIVAALTSTEIEGRTFDVSVDTTAAGTAQRIDAARRSGGHVITVSLRDAEERTLGLWLAGEDREQHLESIDEATEEIEEVTAPPTYTGTWMYVFAGGCAVYDIAASGSGVATLEQDLRSALSLAAVEPFRAEIRSAGFDLP